MIPKQRYATWVLLVAASLITAGSLEAYNTPQSLYSPYSYGTYMEKVEYAGESFTNSVTSGSTSYWDYTSKVGTVRQGENFAVKVYNPLIYYSTYRYQHVHIWIDWDQNNDFNETYGTSSNTGEHYRHGTSGAYYSPALKTVSIPVNQNAQKPGATRMRIRFTASYNTSLAPTIFNNYAYPRYSSYYLPCETEDYTLFVAFPPQLQDVTTSPTWEGTDMVKVAGPQILNGTAPFTWSVQDVSNGGWVTVNPSTGEIGGVAPSVSADTNCTFQLTVVDANGLSDSRSYTAFVRNSFGIPHDYNFDGADNAKYSLHAGAENLTTFAAGQGVSTSTGINITGTTNAGWNVTTAIANDVNQWIFASARPRSGYLEAWFDAVGATVGEVKFSYRITNNTTSANAANAGVLISEDGGATWQSFAGANANSFGGYRNPTGGQFVNESVQFTASGTQDRIGVRLIGLVRNGPASTSVQFDDLELFLPIQITTPTNLPIGQQEVPYAPVQLNAIGGRNGIAGWAIAPGHSLPDGLSLVNTNGTWTIQGIPAALVGGFQTSFDLQVMDGLGGTDTKTFNLSLAAPPADMTIITHNYLPTTALGVPSEWELAATGGLEPYTWSFADPDSVPAWLTISNDGLLAGTPDDPDMTTLDVVVLVQDSTARGAFRDQTTKTLTLLFTDRMMLDPAYFAPGSLVSLPVAEVGRSYNRVIPVVGGTPPYTWSITAGALPSGLTLSVEDGFPFLAGAPLADAAGVYNFTLNISDEAGYSVSDPNYSPNNTGFGTQNLSIAFRLNVGLSGVGSMAIVTPQDDFDTVSEALSASGESFLWLSAAGGRPPYTFAPTGVGMPEWVSVTNEGRLEFYPPMGISGTYLVAVEAVDTASQRATRTFEVMIEEPYILPSIVTDSDLGSVRRGQNFSVTTTIDGGLPPFSMTLVNGTDVDFDGQFEEGGLPSGVTFNPESGRIAGLVLIDAPIGATQFTINVMDGMGQQVSKTFSVVVLDLNPEEALTIATETLEDGVVNEPYAAGLQHAGGVGVVSWSLLPGSSLPLGLTLSSFGIVAGVPVEASQDPVTVSVRVVDEAGATADRSFLLNIAPVAPSSEVTPIGDNPSVVDGAPAAGGGCSVAGSTGSNGWLGLLAFALLALCGVIRRQRA